MTKTLHLPARCALLLEGPDTLALLERLVTNNTMDWQDGEARYGALLTPQGKVISDFLALRTGDRVQLDVAHAAAEDLAKRLRLFRLRANVEIGLQEDMAVFLDPGGFADPRDPALPRRAFHPAGASGADGSPRWRDIRLAAGIAEFGEDFAAADVFPSDINMDRLGGVDLRKGCFVGQEVVSRMHRRGNVRRRTITLTGEGVVAGASVTAGGSTLGEVTSASGPLGLARIRVDRLAKAQGSGADILAGDAAASLEIPAWLDGEIAAHRDHDAKG